MVEEEYDEMVLRWRVKMGLASFGAAGTGRVTCTVTALEVSC